MAAANGSCQDRVILDQWHPLAAVDETVPGVVHATRLLGESVSFAMTADGRAVVWRTRSDLAAGTAVDSESVTDTLPSRCEFLYVWTSLGDPPERSFEIPEFFEPDRRNFNGSTIGVSTSAPRAVENFLDMGHLPILENQNPKLLPLDPRAETPIRSDQASIAYRRWLTDLGVTYGVIPAA